MEPSLKKSKARRAFINLTTGAKLGCFIFIYKGAGLNIECLGVGGGVGVSRRWYGGSDLITSP